MEIRFNCGGGLVAVTAMLALALPAASIATFAGGNGKIFFEGPQGGTSGPSDIFSIDPPAANPST